MDGHVNNKRLSDLRKSRRDHLLKAAKEMVGFSCGAEFNPFHSPLCPIDVVMVAGSPWAADALQRDFQRNESVYRKFGGGANTPSRDYFFRSTLNLLILMQRSGLFIPRGGHPLPTPGMVAFFDKGDRGIFNFQPDRAGIVIETQMRRITRVVLGREISPNTYRVEMVQVKKGTPYDRDFIGYGDIP